MAVGKGAQVAQPLYLQSLSARCAHGTQLGITWGFAMNFGNIVVVEKLFGIIWREGENKS